MRLNTLQKREVKAKIQAIIDEYNLSLSQFYRIAKAMVLPLSSAAFRIPDDKRIKFSLPEEMVVFILSIPNYRTYRPYQLKDMVIDKFPDSGIEPQRIYRTCHYLINKEKHMAYMRQWDKEHPERRKEICVKNNNKRQTLYQESLVKMRGEKQNG